MLRCVLPLHHFILDANAVLCTTGRFGYFEAPVQFNISFLNKYSDCIFSTTTMLMRVDNHVKVKHRSAMKAANPPTCSSTLVFMRGRQSKEVDLIGGWPAQIS